MLPTTYEKPTRANTMTVTVKVRSMRFTGPMGMEEGVNCVIDQWKEFMYWSIQMSFMIPCALIQEFSPLISLPIMNQMHAIMWLMTHSRTIILKMLVMME